MTLRQYAFNNLKKLPFFLLVRDVYTYFSPSLRTKRRIEEDDLKDIVSQVGSLLTQPLYGQNSKTALFMGMGRVRFIALESIVRKSFELANYRCVVMLPQDSIIVSAYKKLGSDRLVFPDRYKSMHRSKGMDLLNTYQTLDDLIALTVNGVRCGKYAASTLMRKNRSGTFDLSAPHIRMELAKALDYSIECVETARAMLDDTKPNVVVLVDRGYSPSGEFFDLCIERKIPVITWNAAHKNDALMFKRYSAENRDVHPSSLSQKTWEYIQRMPWTSGYFETLRNELERCYNSGEWYAEVGTQFNKKSLDRKHLLERLAVDPTKKTAVIFPHIFWDATFFWGNDLFENYEDWFIQTVQAASKNDKVNWVIKVHPANLVKDKRDGVSKEHSELTAIRKAVRTLPSHIRLLAADTDISTLSLFAAMDYCITVRGTVGIEAACFGVPVLTAGTGRFDRLGFTVDANSKEEYLAKLSAIENISALDVQQTELARRYAYGFLLCRPALLQSIKMRYLQTTTADLDIEYKVKTHQELRAANDLQSIARWISSEDEDYF
jgi:hypothetical protein